MGIHGAFLFISFFFFHGAWAQTKIILIHGLGDPGGMQNFAAFLEKNGDYDISIFDPHTPLHSIETQIINENQKSNLVLIGHSQGGFQVVKLATRLKRHNRQANVLVMMGTGGAGRVYPLQWGVNPRKIPSNVDVAMNFYVEGDSLGTDAKETDNFIYSEGGAGTPAVFNFKLSSTYHSHMSLPRCHTASRRQEIEVCSQIMQKLQRVN